MQSANPPVLDRYLDKVIQDNKTIDARGVMQVNRMIELSMEDIFIHLTVRMNRSDKQHSARDLSDLEDSSLESGFSSARKPMQRVPENFRPSYFDAIETEKGVSTDELWRRHATWVILGDPGAGKTTLLKHFALQEATAYKVDQGYLPIFLPLRLFGRKLGSHSHWLLEEAILNYLTQDGLTEMGFSAEQERLELREQFETALSNGRALLLLDGLDEQRDQHVQKRTVKAIESLRQKYPGNRFIVTSRIVGYDAAPLGAVFNAATLEPFNDEQMASFFHQWCYAVEKSEDTVDDEHTRKRAEYKATQLLEQIKDNPGIRLLATNPLLCTIIGLIQRQGATLPELRVELYKLCVDTFIFNWEIKKRHRNDQTGSLDKDQTQAVLEEIALQMHENYPENRMPRDKLIAIVSRFLTAQQGMPETEAEQKSGQLLNLIRDISGLLIDRGNEEYGFFHLTFQEYLTARAITRKKRDIDHYLSRYLFEPRWREVIRLAAAHAGTKDEEGGSEFIEAILRQQHPRENLMHYAFRFAFLCLKEARVEMETSDRMFRQWIEYFINGETSRELFLQLLKQPGAKIRYRSNTLQILIMTLADENPAILSTAAYVLGEIGDKAAVDPLIHSLKDENSGVRSAAVRALGKIGGKAAVDPLIHSLKDENSGVRTTAAWALGKIGDKAAVDPLIHSLKDEDSDVRWAAAEALGKIGDKAAVDPLIHSLKDDNSGIRSAAAEALGKIGDKAAVDPLIHSLKDDNSGIRSAAAEVLGKIGGKAAVDPLIHSLKDDNSGIRWAAVRALGKIGGKAAVDPLIHSLKDDNSGIRWAAVRALGKIGDKAAVDPLIHSLKDEDSDVRWAAAEALGEIGDKTAVDPLIHSLKDEDSGVRWAAVRALGKIGDKAAVDPLIHSLKDEDSDVRWAAAEALGEIGDKTAVDPLIHSLKDENSRVRWAAAEALGKIGDKAAVDPLIHSLKDEDSDVRWAAAEALGEIGDKTAVDPLIHSLKDENSRVRWTAVRALGKIGDKAAVDPLIHSLKDENSGIHRMAIQAIEEIDLKFQLCPD